MKNLLNHFGQKKKDNEFLQKFVNQIYFRGSLSNLDAITNLQNGLVEIVYPSGQHSSNGLLITESGYFLTPYHCLEDGKKRRIKIASGKSFPIQRLCSFSRKQDIALAKAKLFDSPNIFEYKFSLDDPKRDAAFILNLRRGGNLILKTAFNKNIVGQVIYRDGNSVSERSSSRFSTLNAVFEQGDSGGVVSDYSGKLFGFLTSTDKISTTNFIKFYSAIECIEYYRSSLMR